MPDVPMRAQADNQPPPFSNRQAKLERWRRQLKEALTVVDPAVSKDRSRENWITLRNSELALFQEVDFLIRDGVLYTLRGPIEVGDNYASYSIYSKQPATQPEVKLWGQAVASHSILSRMTNLIGDMYTAFPDVTDPDAPKDQQ